MARKTSTELFELVKTMTPSEKRYFKLFASLHTVGSENKYMKLFDLIEQSEVYNEDKLIVGVNDKGGVTFSKLKRYLYSLILKSMRNYNVDKNGTHQLTSAVDDVSILFNKGLYAQAGKAIQKAEKIIEENDLLSYNFLIDNWKRRINLHLDAKKEANQGELDIKLNEFNELNEQMDAFGLMQEFTRTCSVITSIDELPEVIAQKLKVDVSKFSSQKILFFNLRIKSIVYRLMRDFDAYLKVSKKAYDISVNHAGFQNEDVLIYTLEPLLEYCNALLNNRQYADFNKYLRKTKPYIIASKMSITAEGRANIDAFVNLMQSEYDRLNGNNNSYDEHVATIKTIKSDEALHPSPALKNLYYWELINWHFKMNEVDSTVVAINRMKKDIPNYQTIQAATTLKWICFFQQKKYSELKHLLENSKVTSSLEAAISETLLEQLENETMGKWMNLKNELVKLRNLSNERIHFKFFDFVEWVNQKMLNDNSLAPNRKQLHYFHH